LNEIILPSYSNVTEHLVRNYMSKCNKFKKSRKKKRKITEKWRINYNVYTCLHVFCIQYISFKN